MTLRRGHLVISIVLLAILAYAMYDAANLSPRSRLFPLSITIPAVVLAAAQVIRIARADAASDPVAPPEARVTRDALLWTAAFFAGVWTLGLVVTMALFSAVYLRLVAKGSWALVALYAIGIVGFTYGLFVAVLHIPLPAGVVGIGIGG